ncbi:MAG: ribosome maturation factor RimM [Geobacteraceae bacterium]|nr:ribosome maturation factor RimM [Geobacteraceae bacterium]
MQQENELIVVGKVLGTHGIRGQLRVLPYSGEASSITSHRSLLFRLPDGKCETYEIDGAVEHGKRILVSLKGHGDINQVLPLVGSEICILRRQLPRLPEGEYYWCDLLGLTVESDQGEVLGELVDIMPTGSNDVYVVKSVSGEYLIPATEDVVREIDLEHRRMVVEPLDGLLEL